MVVVAGFLFDQSSRSAFVDHTHRASAEMVRNRPAARAADGAFLVDLLVALEITLDGECAVAAHAFERLLAGMTIAMDLETAGAGEGFAAAGFHALVAVLGAQGGDRAVAQGAGDEFG